MAQLTVADAPVALTQVHALRSGRTVVLKALNGYELMLIDDFAVGQDGQLRMMRIPYLRALASLQSVNDAPFGPIRSEIDVQRWAQTLSADELSELVEVVNAPAKESVEQIKNESAAPSDDLPPA